MPAFTPAHNQPVTLAQLRLLEPELLSNEIARLQNSIAHLERSNDELRAFVRGEGEEEDGDEGLDDETKRELEDTVRENEETVARQQERITMIRLALEEQVGVDARNPHYALAGSAPASAPVEERRAALPPRPSAQEDGDEVMGVAAASTTTSAAPPRAGVNGVQDSGGEDDGMYL
ncbi:hypothetical protein JCM10450v2_005942 [Rhodotorula kratochvilovae]